MQENEGPEAATDGDGGCLDIQPQNGTKKEKNKKAKELGTITEKVK